MEEMESRFLDLLQQPPYPVEGMLQLIGQVPNARADEWTALLLSALEEAQDFDGAWKVVSARRDALEAKVRAIGVRDALKRATKDRLLNALVDCAFPIGENSQAQLPLKESLARLDRLLHFRPGTLVLHKAWGVGEVKRLDYFYRRLTADFRNRRAQQFSFQAASETLVPAPENHILVTQKADPARIDAMLKEHPEEFVKAMLSSFGDMPVTRLADLSSQFGFVKSANWKAFWEKARAVLRADRLVEVPLRHSEPLHLKTSPETYGENWFIAFAGSTDPKSILSSVRELGLARLKTLDEDSLAKIADRLAFALKASRGMDDALFARIAFCVQDLKFLEPSPSKARAYLLEQDRYLQAATKLPARDMPTLVAFLVAEDGEAVKKRLFEAMPRMCFPLLSAILEYYKSDRDCEEIAAALLKQPHAPATLITYILARYNDFRHWTLLPPLVVILTHAIALGEGRQSGETLRMQNTIRRLFADQPWLENVFAELQAPADRAIFFERFQASVGWDPATHHMIVVRMMHIDPSLASRQVRKETSSRPVERITSRRSYEERKAAYLHLVNVEIPKNSADIEFARGYGDLSENFEYQSAKDEQRALLQKQSLMQEELNAVKAVDFADVPADEVRAGTTVRVVAGDGTELAYTILGEWDNAPERNIISNKTKLAANLLGKKPGDTFDLPDTDGGSQKAIVKEVLPLDDELKAWAAATTA